MHLKYGLGRTQQKYQDLNVSSLLIIHNSFARTWIQNECFAPVLKQSK